MKCNTIKTGAMPGTGQGFGKNQRKPYVQTCQMISANLGEEKSWAALVADAGNAAKDTTSDMRPLDIRRLHRAGLLTPGRAFGWHWTVNGEEVASIQMRTEVDRVILDYRNRSNGGEWRADGIPGLSGMDGPAILAGGGRGSFARRKDAGGAWRFSSAVQSSPVGTVTSWPMPASGKPTMIERCDGRTPSGGGLGGAPG
jgi:hypothetical protein